MKLSVIVCTHNRAYALAACLDSIAGSISAAQPVEAEIVVVSNACTDNTSQLVTEWAKQHAFSVRLLDEPKKGLATARNCGIRGAKGDLLAFTDDDCRMTLDYVQSLLRYDSIDTGLVIRGGRIDLGDPTDLPLTIKTDPTPMLWDKSVPTARHELIGGKSISGCNMTMRRKLIDTIGLFDERLGAGTKLPGGEDTDYLLRAYLADIPIAYVPDMAVSHLHGRKTASDGKRLMQNYLIATGALYAKYCLKDPSLCREFYWDTKKALKELVNGNNAFLPEYSFSYKDKVVCCLRGIVRFAWQDFSHSA